jgi:hypothetical protein
MYSEGWDGCFDKPNHRQRRQSARYLPHVYGQTYYNWIEAWGGQVFNVKDLVVPLGLNLLRVGGTPEDVSDPEMFDSNQIDKFVAYAADVGAQPLVQIPFVGTRDAANNLIPATSQNAAAMVQYANVTRGYGIRYFSIGNEPDIYEVIADNW